MFIVGHLIFLNGVIFAQEQETNRKEDKKNDLALFLGGTSNSKASAVTLGLDYQFRISNLVGVGAVLDYATGDLKSLLIAPAVFFHVSEIEIVLAPGVEFSNEEISAIFRVGLSYEFKISKKITISPSLIFDTERNLEEPIVYGVAFGFGL